MSSSPSQMHQIERREAGGASDVVLYAYMTYGTDSH